MKRIDIILALVIGEIIAWFFYGILKNLEIEINSLGLILAVSFPILSIFCLWISYLIGKKFLFVFQLAKFLLMGALATLVDLGLLNVLMMTFGIGSGLLYSVFKGISFIIATCSKYIGDKFWAFEKTERKGIRKEFGQFLLVTFVGFGINVGIAHSVVNIVGPQFNLDEKIWANIGGILAAFGTFAWNFIGYKFIVFKK